jgi:hypothetical protein
VQDMTPGASLQCGAKHGSDESSPTRVLGVEEVANPVGAERLDTPSVPSIPAAINVKCGAARGSFQALQGIVISTTGQVVSL